MFATLGNTKYSISRVSQFQLALSQGCGKSLRQPVIERFQPGVHNELYRRSCPDFVLLPLAVG